MSAAASHIEYQKALRLGLREKKDRSDAGRNPYPAVLDEQLPNLSLHTVQELPLQEIPIDRIVGTKSAGRVNSFSAGFYPLLEETSEFASKWISLCEAHLSDTGIRDPITCYEYLGNFYVEEGNKRVSVMKYFGAVQIPAHVRRVLPKPSDDPQIVAYGEFLSFYRLSGLYDVLYTKPGEYAKLLAYLGKDADTVWTEDERRTFIARYHYFRAAFAALDGMRQDLSCEEALLVWLNVHSYEQLSRFTAKELKDSLSALWGEVVVKDVTLCTEPESGSPSVLDKILSYASGQLQIALLYQQDEATSPWTRAHRQGAAEMEAALAPHVRVRHYFHADTPEMTEKLLEKAVSDGASFLFTTTPLMLRPTLKVAVRYPKAHFLNCSVDTSLSSVRSYYCKTYEGKFITGLIAGAMAENDLVGYIGSYPIRGVPASINAFALGAQMSNPRAKILLEWSCLPGDPVQKLREKGACVISNRDIPLQDPQYLQSGLYGTFRIDADGQFTPLASPVWRWGKLYEHIIRSALDGSWSQHKGATEAVNLWWGISSDVIDVEMSAQIPEGIRTLASLIRKEIRDGRADPFRRRITAQDGRLINDGTRELAPLELLRMDWLCDNVEGSFPAFDALSPISQPLVRELGICREQIPPEKEGHA